MELDKLVVIAGPSGIGKSFLIDRLGQGAFTEFSNEIGITEPGSWSHVLAMQLEETDQLEADRLILHYDLTRASRLKLRSGYREDKPLRILRTANEITVVTLWARPEIILRRFITRQKPNGNNTRPDGKFVVRLPDFTQFYMNASRLRSLYREWNEFCGEFNFTAHWLVNTMDDPWTYTPCDEHSFRVMVESLA